MRKFMFDSTRYDYKNRFRRVPEHRCATSPHGLDPYSRQKIKCLGACLSQPIAPATMGMPLFLSHSLCVIP